jgi:hypothetical protein
MDLAMSEKVATWILDVEGQWKRRSVDDEGNQLPDMQDELMQLTLNKKRIR